MTHKVWALIVGGGGGGGQGTTRQGGGGGAGGHIENIALDVAEQAYSIVVGAGGVGATDTITNGNNGANSSGLGLIAPGGGGGASGFNQVGSNGGGGGGGGAAGGSPGFLTAGGVGGQFNGGSGRGSSTTGNRAGGGGGGAGGVGENSTAANGGDGGIGVSSSISGSPIARAGGGGGGGSFIGLGMDGGGNGGRVGTSLPQNGTVNTGGGGGGTGAFGGPDNGAAGGSGVVIIAYKTDGSDGVTTASTGGTVTTSGAYTIHTFTSDGTFTVVFPFEVITYAVTDVTKHTATGNGEVVSGGGNVVTERGFCWDTSTNPTTSDDKVIVAGTIGTYSGGLTGLDPGTLYYVRAYAITSAGTEYGDNVTFQTIEAITIATNPVTDIDKFTATGNGTISDDGGVTIIERGFCWDTSIDPTIGDDKVIVAGTLGVYDGILSPLDPGTFYYVRAYATTAMGTSYGENQTFTTLDVHARIGALDTGFLDYDEPIYFEFIDRWRSYTDLYAKVESISGINIYTENAAGARVYFQEQKAPPNAWGDPIGTVDENSNSLFPNASTMDYNAGRLRVAGFSSGVPVVIHSIEILSVQDKGFDQN